MQKLKYPHLFEPLKVNKMIIQNRIISAPLGSLTDKSISGIGMIIRGTSGNVPGGKSRIAPGPYCFENMQLSQKVREEVSIIRQRGAKAEFELCHVGQYAIVEPGDFAIGPVSFTREDGVEVRGMDEAMMDEVADQFARGAKDAKEYGFDMVMLHFGHGWLPTQFLSPHYNKRTDEYGGSFENRIKFPTMIVDRIRKAVGPDYPLDMRISGYEFIEDGTSPEEVVKFIKSIEGKIDMVHISCGLERELKAMTHMSSSAYFPHKINTKWSKRVKEVVNIPVAVVGAIMTPEEAEGIIANGEADAVVIGRQIIADPFWTSKAREGKSEDIVPCLRCLNCYNMYARDRKNHYGMKSITNCAVNPRYLHEDRVPVAVKKAETKKKVYVLGGGPAGMKAAITASERGHDVVLLEKNDYLGGQLQCADFDDSKIDLKHYKDYLITQVKKTNIELRLNCDALDCKEELEQADAVIIAVGAEPIIPRIEGSENAHVMNALEAYEKQDTLGDEVVIVGGGSVGIELAKLLATIGKKVTVVEMTDTICANLNEHARTGLLEKVGNCKDLTILKKAQCSKIGDNFVEVKTENETLTLKADNVILSVGFKARKEVVNSFYGIVQDTNIIGDANRPATVAEATQDAYYASASL